MGFEILIDQRKVVSAEAQLEPGVMVQWRHQVLSIAPHGPSFDEKFRNVDDVCDPRKTLCSGGSVMGVDRLDQRVGETPELQEFATYVRVVEAEDPALGFGEILMIIDTAIHESFELPAAAQVDHDASDIVQQARYKETFDVVFSAVNRQ